MLLFNPFRPNNMVGPDMFVGRGEELRLVEKCLFQTLNENPQHFLIEGERGIGKSSLLLYLRALATGKISAPNYPKGFSFLCVSVDLGKCNLQLQIIQKIAQGLKQELNRQGDVKEKAIGIWNWLTNWEIMGVKINKQADTIDPDTAAQELVTKLSELVNGTDFLDGVVILLDEADSPETEAELGKFLKLSSERLQRENCNKVVFGLAGLPTLLGKLKVSHESSPRLFEILTLQPLSYDERKTVVVRALKRASEKNENAISISPDALDELCDFSEGYPHFLQQFGYSAFESNQDADIDIEDVYVGAFSDGGAISQLGAKFFSDMYHARISSDDYRKVLDTMAEHGDKWIKKSVIQSESEIVPHTVGNALKALKAKNIITYDDSRTGFYRLPTRSFAAWINATKKRDVAES